MRISFIRCHRTHMPMEHFKISADYRYLCRRGGGRPARPEKRRSGAGAVLDTAVGDSARIESARAPPSSTEEELAAAKAWQPANNQ